LDLHVPGGRPADRAGTAIGSNDSDEDLVSVMSWLIGTLTQAGQRVVSLGCGDCPCGVAALSLGRLFHGIESDRDAIDRAAARLKRVEQAAAK
jgi:DNA modification methylase